MVRFERNLIYTLPVISIVFEIFQSFFPGLSGVMGLRNYSFFLILLYLNIKYFSIGFKFIPALFLFMIYLLLVLMINNVEFKEYSDWVRAFDCKMLLPLGFALTSTYDHIKEFNKRLMITNVLFVISIVIFSFLGIGENQYGGDSGFSVGRFSFNSIYTGSFLLIILPIVYTDIKGKAAKNALALLGLCTLVILVLSVRRTSVIFIIISSLVYTYIFRDQLSKIVLRAILVIILLIAAFPLYQDMLLKQVAARSNVFNERGVKNLQEETRLEESIAVWDERILSPDIKLLLFGKYLFDSPGHYDGGTHGERPLHLDLNVILHGSGIIGLILLLSFYGNLFYKSFMMKAKLDHQNEKLLIGAFFGMYFSHLFLLISGGMLTITFNIISYTYMGGILGLYRNKMAEDKIEKKLMKERKPKGIQISNINVPKPKPFMYNSETPHVKFMSKK